MTVLVISRTTLNVIEHKNVSVITYVAPTVQIQYTGGSASYSTEAYIIRIIES